MRYFGRVYQLDVELNSGQVEQFGGIPEDGQIYEPLQIQFKVDQSPNGSFSLAEITLYGLRADRRKALYENGATVTLTAGWRNNYGVVFSGFIRNVEIGRSGPNQFLKLFCSSTDETIQQATFRKAYASGTAQVDIIREVAASFGFPVELVGDFSGLPAAIKGKTVGPGRSARILYGMSRDFDFTWIVYNGVTWVVRNDARNNVEPVIYKTTNGIIGSPEITELGVNIDVLLNPNLRPWDTYTVESETAALSVNGVYYQSRTFPKTNGESTNRIIRMSHEGDFYGDVWQTRIEGDRNVANQ